MSYDLTGQLLGGRYRILRIVGEGGMGSVYEATQEDLGRRVAIKVVAPSLAMEPLYIERFRREALAAAQLGHPNIVQVTDFQHAPGELPFLVMELLEGEPMQARLKRGRLTPAEAVDITRQLLAALEAAHAQGIVHRDLKPANVFLVPMADRVLVKVVDFGIAKLTESATFARLTQTGMMIGTPRYAAPEQIRDSSSVDARTDVYSAGLLLFCMLSGRVPFTSSGAQLMLEVESLPAPDLRTLVPTIDPGLAQLVARAMEKQPSRRFSSAREMSDALTPFIDGGKSVHAPPVAGTAPMNAVPTPARSYAPPHTPSVGAPATRVPTQQLGAHANTQAPPTRQPREPAPSSQGRVILLTALSVVLVAFIGVAAAGGTWFVLSSRSSRRASSTPIPIPIPNAVTVPEACLEWERTTCSCPNTNVRAQYCSMAHATILAYRDGDASADCPALLSAMRLACSVPNE